VLASVIGREFALEELARVGCVSEDDLLDVLDEAMTARAISDVPGAPGHLRFAHVLIRDTLSEGPTTARRVRLHRLVVEALETLYGEDPGPHLAELAHHSIAGTEFEKGLDYAWRAGDLRLGSRSRRRAWAVRDAAGSAVDFETGYANPATDRMVGATLEHSFGGRLRAGFARDHRARDVQAHARSDRDRYAGDRRDRGGPGRTDRPAGGSLRAPLHPVRPKEVMNLTTDITAQRRLEAELERYAKVDPATVCRRSPARRRSRSRSPSSLHLRREHRWSAERATAAVVDMAIGGIRP